MTEPTIPATVGLWAWHVHHECLVERLTDPLEARIDYIRESKPAHEIETRLRLLRVATDQAGIYRWAEAMRVADAARTEAMLVANAAWDEAARGPNAARVEAMRGPDANLAALHSRECPDCPWNGKTIFSEAP